MSATPSWVTLTEGEEIIRQDHPALAPYLLGSLGSVVILVVGLLVIAVDQGLLSVPFDIPDRIPLGLVGVVIVVIGALGVIQTLIRWYSLEYLITTEEVYKKRGLFSRSVTNFRHEQIQNTSFSQSITGRILGHGDVMIATAGTGHTDMILANVKDPEGIVETLTRQAS